MPDPATAFVSEKGQRLVIGEGTTRDELQVSGAWLDTDTPIGLRAVR